MTTSPDILISGGGVAGLSAACLFGAAGFSVVCVDPTAPVTEEAAEGADLRTTALLQPARELLDEAGIWARLAPFATPLWRMRIVDAGGALPSPRLRRDFEATDLGNTPFGWNLPNWLLRRELMGRIAELPGVSFCPGVATADVLARSAGARVALSDGRTLTPRLLIAADGRNSPVRASLGIGARTLRYGQKALAFAVTHPEPHENVSTEIHRSGGPFTLVPLPDRGGQPCSAVVWMERGPEALRLTALPDAAFNAEMTARSGAILGPLVAVTRRSVWPIISQIAHRFDGPGTVLAAEAAHVVPPIGAQGLNMSLADFRLLLELARAAPAALGSPEMCAEYARRRRPDVTARVLGIDLLNRTSMQGARPLRDARALGIAGLHALPPVRRLLMQVGLGARVV